MTDAGEKMLTERRLIEIEFEANRDARIPFTRIIHELMPHIRALSATIKRLETPVAEGEVGNLVYRLMMEQSLGTRQVQLRHEAASMLSHQAREIERMRQALTKHAVVSRHRMCSGGATRHWGYSCEICEAQVTDEENTPKLSDLKHALTCPLSLNSVETREMKP